MKKRTVIILVIISIVAISIALYTILPLFTNTVVDEPLPTASGITLAGFEIENLVNREVNQIQV
jgi:hypothetical protein